MAEIIYDIEENTFAIDGKTFAVENDAEVSPTDIKIGLRLEDDGARVSEAHTIAEEIEIKYPTYTVTARITNVTHEKNCTGLITYIEMLVNKHIELETPIERRRVS